MSVPDVRSVARKVASDAAELKRRRERVPEHNLADHFDANLGQTAGKSWVAVYNPATGEWELGAPGGGGEYVVAALLPGSHASGPLYQPNGMINVPIAIVESVGGPWSVSADGYDLIYGGSFTGRGRVTAAFQWDDGGRPSGTNRRMEVITYRNAFDTQYAVDGFSHVQGVESIMRAQARPIIVSGAAGGRIQVLAYHNDSVDLPILTLGNNDEQASYDCFLAVELP